MADHVVAVQQIVRRKNKMIKGIGLAWPDEKEGAMVDTGKRYWRASCPWTAKNHPRPDDPLKQPKPKIELIGQVEAGIAFLCSLDGYFIAQMPE